MTPLKCFFSGKKIVYILFSLTALFPGQSVILDKDFYSKPLSILKEEKNAQQKYVV